MTARFTPPAVDAANRPFEYRWCGIRYQMPPTAIWITPERFPHGRGRLFLGNVDHALDDHWCDTNQVRQRYHSFHAFVVLRILCGRAAATGRIPSFPAEGPVFRRREGMFCQIASPHHGCEHGLSSRWFLGVSGSRETRRTHRLPLLRNQLWLPDSGFICSASLFESELSFRVGRPGNLAGFGDELRS
jgi:hypothetical protein